ncbi:MAG: hypothetical protein Cons2KO_05700 [Congregibacter sp.]
MGIEINSTAFDAADRERFTARLEAQLEALGELLNTPDFGRGPISMGAELELYLVDADGHPSCRNEVLSEAADDEQLTVELNQYNLEYNLSPVMLGEAGLRATEAEIESKLRGLASLAAEHDTRVVPIGILPTLRPEDFGRQFVTPRKRYHALVDRLIASRGSDFEIDINGRDPLKLAVRDITLEGANTSFQVHLRVDPERFADTFNAIQLVTPLALAISANSPGLFGHQLWDETRIPLFKQSIDTRHEDRYQWSEPARVSFGHGWARRGALELFEQAVRLYPPLLPACEADPRPIGPNGLPELAEMRLHQSTVWLWNRPVYDDHAGGHLRIEMRAAPAGPTAVDMVAGAALMIGLAHGMRDRVDALLPAIPFPLAEYNFYRAAQHGLAARLVWPGAAQNGLNERPIVDILGDLLPLADAGLSELGVAQSERDRYLNVIDARLAARRNGASWQRECTQLRIAQGCDKPDALRLMLSEYQKHSRENIPVSEWPL